MSLSLVRSSGSLRLRSGSLHSSLRGSLRAPPLLRSFSGSAFSFALSGRRMLGSLLAGTALYCAYELGSLVFSWPVPCETMLERARASPEVSAALGLPIRLAHPFWTATKISEQEVKVMLPILGSSGAEAELHGAAVKVGKEWRILVCEVSQGGRVLASLHDSAPSKAQQPGGSFAEPAAPQLS